MGLGYAFVANIEALASLPGIAAAAMTAAAVTAALGVLLWRVAKARH